METNVLTEMKSFQADLNERLDRQGKRIDTIEALQLQPTVSAKENSSGLADALWNTPEYRNWTDTGCKGRLTLKLNLSPGELQTKTSITSSAVGSSTPGILVPSRVPGIVKPGVRGVRVRDLLPMFPTSNNAVEFVKENAFTNAASPQTEASDKAESALTFTIDSSPVRTIAHWIPASKQVLMDFGELQAYLNQRLIDGLLDKEDSEILTGDGLGVHLSGFTLEATAYDTARNAVGDTYIDKLNHAISQIEDVDLKASGIILHPRDWRAIQLIKDQASNVGSYVMGGPKGDAEPMLWGLPVATSTAVTVGKFFVGAFATHTALWARMAVILDVSTEHSDFFIKNMVAVRCEERVALTVYRSDALVYGSF